MDNFGQKQRVSGNVLACPAMDICLYCGQLSPVDKCPCHGQLSTVWTIVMMISVPKTEVYLTLELKFAVLSRIYQYYIYALSWTKSIKKKIFLDNLYFPQP